MNYRSIGIVVFGGILQAIGSAVLKYSTALLKVTDNKLPGFIGLAAALGLVFCGFPLYKLGLSRLKLSLAQPVFSTTLFLTSTLLSVTFFHDSFSVRQLVGLLVIITGVLLVIRSSDPLIE